MPHVVLNKTIDLQEFAKKFGEIIKKDNGLIKIENIFVDKNNQIALLPALVVDKEKQDFFIQILTNEEKTTIRLLPLTDPKKTDGVKTALGLVTSELIKYEQNASVVRTNIGEFITK